MPLPTIAHETKDFQSHAGSIEAMKKILIGDAAEIFSIPRWFD